MYTMGKRISATQARKQFFKLLEEAGRSGADIRITFEGHPSVILLSEEEYEGWLETLEVMSDPVLMQDIRKGMREKKTIPWETVKKQLRL